MQGIRDGRFGRLPVDDGDILALQKKGQEKKEEHEDNDEDGESASGSEDSDAEASTAASAPKATETVLRTQAELNKKKRHEHLMRTQEALKAKRKLMKSINKYFPRVSACAVVLTLL